MKINLLLILSFFLESTKYLTTKNSGNGFGSQYQVMLSALALAEHQGAEFVFNPLSACAHNYSSDSLFVEKLNDFMGLRNKFKSASDFESDILGKKEKLNITDYGCIYFVDRNVDAWLKVKQKARLAYFSSPKPKLPFYHNLKNVAVHVRRRNVEDIRETFLYDRYYFDIMNKIKTKYTNACFHIYSQVDPAIATKKTKCISNFDIYKKKFSAKLHLDKSIEETFHAMVMADILVTSDSSFSYAAALLSEGEIYYHK